MKTIYIDDGDALNIDRVIVSMTDLKGCKVFYSCDLIDEYESKLKADMAAILDKTRTEIKAKQDTILYGYDHYDDGVMDGLDFALELIDKAEGSDKE